MRLDLVRDAAAAARLPEVLAERCVHSLIEQAGCRRCVDACPTGAWVIDDERLGIDPARCDGCGLCAPACPQAAIVGTAEPLRVGAANAGRSGGNFAPGASDGAALLACDRAWPDGSAAPGAMDGVVPCVHALGLRDLARLAAAGCRRVVIATGDCDICPRGTAVRLSSRLADLARLLDSRALPHLRLERLDAEKWEAARAAAVPDAGPAMGRRSFLRRGLGLAVEQASAAFGLAAAERRGVATVAQLLPATDVPPPLVPVAPVIDPPACTGCDACARLCPQDAIALESAAGELAYRLTPAACTACGICVDVCADAAIRLEQWTVVAPSALPLGQATCSRCGVRFHRPVLVAGSGPVRCPVCEKRSGPDRLFRVQE